MTREIQLSQGFVALVDDRDYEDLAIHRWHVKVHGRTAYACRTTRDGGKKTTTRYMHAQITGYVKTDHVNGDGLDNRRANLREATAAQNSRNQRPVRSSASKYIGVTWHFYGRSAVGKWRAQITSDGKKRHLGLFATEEEAARAYDRAAYERDPEFCRLNFPEEFRT